MIIFLAIIALIIAIIVLSIRYFMIYARLKSHTSMDTEARRRAQVLRFEDPIITCDYCGATIDTSKHEVCPKCGAAYSHDEEWTSKFDVDPNWVEDNAEEMYQQELASTRAKAARTAKLLKRCILILVGILVLIIGLYMAIRLTGLDQNYTKSEELNESSYEKYSAVSYSITSDPVIVDSEDARMTLTGIYKDEDSDNVKLEYKLENLSDKDLRFRSELLAVNGVSHDNDGGLMYDLIKKNTSVTIYEELRHANGEIGELRYGGIQVSTEKDYTDVYATSDIFTITTDATGYEMCQLPDECSTELIYDDNGIKIYTTEIPADEYSEARQGIMVVGDSEHDFQIANSKYRVNGVDSDYSNIYKEVLLKDCCYYNPDLSVRNSDGDKAAAGDKIEMSFSFVCADDPSRDFSTAYLALR